MPSPELINIFEYYFFANRNKEGVAHSHYCTFFCATKTPRHKAILISKFLLSAFEPLWPKIRMSSA